MRFWTSYFGNVRNIPSDIVPVGIAGRSPKWWKGLEYKKLAPSWDIFSKWKYQHHDDGIYTARFNAERLGKLNFSNVVNELMNLSDNKDICLLCYEIPGMFCHRHLVAKWFTEHGFTTLELTKDSVRTVIQADAQPSENPSNQNNQP